jgi:hypothetical protein
MAAHVNELNVLACKRPCITVISSEHNQEFNDIDATS